MPIEVFVSEKELKIADSAVKVAQELIKKGYQEKQVVQKVKKIIKKINIPFSAKDAYIAARIRLKAKEKFGILAEKLFFDESGYRYSTPSIVAEYRADRVKCGVADVSCGAGMQLAFFGFKGFSEGVEIDKKRAFLAAMNVQSLNSNATVYWGDAFEFKTSMEIVFSDPARPESEEVRTLSSLKPSPLKLIEKFSKKQFVFELPPQMPPERVNIEGEKEYTSLSFRLNRLALYTGELGSCDVSAVSLPSRERVTSDDEKLKLRKGRVGDTIAEVDRTVTHSGLLENLAGKLGLEAEIIHSDGRRTLLSARNVVESAFLRYYEVIFTANSVSECAKKLKKEGAGKATIRFQISPNKYWELRKKLEKDLKGEKKFHIFKIGNSFVGCLPYSGTNFVQ